MLSLRSFLHQYNFILSAFTFVLAELGHLVNLIEHTVKWVLSLQSKASAFVSLMTL